MILLIRVSYALHVSTKLLVHSTCTESIIAGEVLPEGRVKDKHHLLNQAAIT